MGRGELLSINEYYHVYNRGADKRNIFGDTRDFDRFIEGMKEFNTTRPLGSLRDNGPISSSRSTGNRSTGNKETRDPLVEIVCFCLNKNHYHLLLRQLVDEGISKFIQKIAGGYTRYYNEKNRRNGVLFQGKYKFVKIDSNEQLLRVSAYINFNNVVHGIHKSQLNLFRSSLDEYIGKNGDSVICRKSIILEQFKNSSEYEKFAKDALKHTLTLREKDDPEIYLLLE